MGFAGSFSPDVRTYKQLLNRVGKFKKKKRHLVEKRKKKRGIQLNLIDYEFNKFKKVTRVKCHKK